MSDTYVYGIAHRTDDITAGEIHRDGMSEVDAHLWLTDWRVDGGKIDAFRVVRRKVCPWEEVE